MDVEKLEILDIQSVHLGTRVEAGRFGFMTQDMEISDFISLFTTKENRDVYIFPDFSGLIERLEERIKSIYKDAHRQAQEDELLLKYDILYNRWKQTGTIAEPRNRGARFEKLMDESVDFLFLNKKMMPYFDYGDISNKDLSNVSIKGQMYCFSLLLHVIGRAGYESSSFSTDSTMIEHCEWMKNWIIGKVHHRDISKALLYASFENKDYFYAINKFWCNENGVNIDTYISKHVRDNGIEYEKHSNKKEVTIKIDIPSREQLSMLETLSMLMLRINRVEGLIKELSENNSINFDDGYHVGKWITEKIKEIELK